MRDRAVWVRNDLFSFRVAGWIEHYTKQVAAMKCGIEAGHLRQGRVSPQATRRRRASELFARTDVAAARVTVKP
jgi:hypothetical protein